MNQFDLSKFIKHYHPDASDVLFENDPDTKFDLFVLRSKRTIWLFKDQEFYRTSNRIVDFYAATELLKEYCVVEVPFFINLNKNTLHKIFPGERKEFPKDYIERKSCVSAGDPHPQDFCLIGIKAFYDDLCRFDKNTVMDVNESIQSHPSFLTNPYNIQKRASELFITSFHGLSGANPEEEYVLRNGWNLVKLTQDACCYAENLGFYIVGGKLKEKDLFDYLFNKAGTEYSPLLIKELCSQIYFDTINGKNKQFAQPSTTAL